MKTIKKCKLVKNEFEKYAQLSFQSCLNEVVVIGDVCFVFVSDGE